MPGTCQSQMIFANPLCYQSKEYWGWQGQAFFKFLYCAYLAVCLGEEALLWTVLEDFFPTRWQLTELLNLPQRASLIGLQRKQPGEKMIGDKAMWARIRWDSVTTNLRKYNIGQRGPPKWVWLLLYHPYEQLYVEGYLSSFNYTEDKDVWPQHKAAAAIILVKVLLLLPSHFPHLSRQRLKGTGQGKWLTHSFIPVPQRSALSW